MFMVLRSARRQLAFDIWWLAGALWVICIIEVRPSSVPSWIPMY